MGIKRQNILALLLIGFLFTSTINSAYSEVQSVQTDTLFYKKGDKITFSGTVNHDSTGLVTIVIRDSNDKFVLLTQALIQHDNTYQKSVETNEKFSTHGIYNATAFIVNMTEGALTRFDFSINGAPVNPSVSKVQDEPQETVVQQPQVVIANEPEPEPEPISKIASFVDPSKDPQYYIERYNNEIAYKNWFDKNYSELTIKEAVGLDIEVEDKNQNISKIPGFPDPDKDPQYYVDRYNNESKYREWFDRNFPEQTIYQVVGINVPELSKNDIVNSTTENTETSQKTTPSLIESSTVNPTLNSENNEIGQMLLALGGLGVLFGAVYGIKRKVDNNSEQISTNKSFLQKKVEHNSEQISQNRFWLKKKLMNLKSNEAPIELIKARLAKGEITVDDYYKLLRALKK